MDACARRAGPDALAGAVGRLVDEVRGARGDDLVVGLEIRGPVNQEEGVAQAGLVEAGSGVHALVLSDVEALVTYERWFELRDSVARYGVLLVDEGVTGALVVDGRVDTDMPMELGKIIVHPDGRRWCPCGNRGCVEATVAAQGIVERVREDGDLEVTDLAEAVDLAACLEGHRGARARAAFRTAGRDLAAGIDAVQALADLQAWVVYVPAALGVGTAAKDGFLSGLTDARVFTVHLRAATAERGALEEFGISSPRGAGREATFST